MENGRGDRFSYDEEGQLVEAWYNAADPANAGTGNTRYDIFSYDEMGNRKDWACVGNKWMHYLRRDNGLNQYASWENNYPNGDPAHWGTAIYHDDNSPWDPYRVPPGNGVTMAEGNLVASYNALNQPVVMIPNGQPWIWFGFDPLGRCVKRTVGSALNNGTSKYFFYDGWNLIQEGPAAGYADRQYIHGARVDDIVKQITPPNGYERYFHYDGRGHCTHQTDASGNLVEQYEYDAFGLPYFYDGAGNNIGYSPFGNRFLFTGREWIGELRLYDYRNRMYQPELGRFLQPDPKQFAAGDYNLYRYCHNDPVNKSDPFGLREFKLRIVLPVHTGSNLKREVTCTFEGYKSAILAGKAGGKHAADTAIVTELHGRMAQVDSAPGWYIYGPAVPGIIIGTQNTSDLWGDAAGPLPSGTTEAGMYWVLGRHQDPISWPVDKKSGISDGQRLRNEHRTGVLTNPPPKGGGQFTYHWYDAEKNQEGY